MILIGTADTLNKRARQAGIPIGSYLIVQSFSYTLVILTLTLLSGGITWQRADIIYGLIGAIFGFAGFTLMLHSLTHGQASVNYAIFRSSFVFSAAAAVILLNEKMPPMKIFGISLAILAIVSFFHIPRGYTVKRRSMITALVAMVIAAGFQLVIKLSTQVFSSPLSYILIMNLFFGIFALGYNILFGTFEFPKATFLFAPANGFLMAVGTFFYVVALHQGELSSAIPVIQLSFVITALLSALFLKEQIGIRKALGIACAAVAIIVLGII
jgi:drug/metabolite transporter (DMT)-like permease